MSTLTRENIEELVRAGGTLRLTDTEADAFMGHLAPQLETWGEDFGEIPYELVQAYLSGFLCCLEVMKT